MTNKPPIPKPNKHKDAKDIHANVEQVEDEAEPQEQ